MVCVGERVAVGVVVSGTDGVLIDVIMMVLVV